jgi:hypothetical protein
MFPPHTRTSSSKQRSHQTAIAALYALLGLLCTILCPLARAQTAGTGALGGDITDPSGANVANAKIKMTSETREETWAPSK